MVTRYLTKSRFKLALCCSTKLYYTGKSAYENSNDRNEFLAMLADGGFQVGTSFLGAKIALIRGA